MRPLPQPLKGWELRPPDKIQTSFFTVGKVPSSLRQRYSLSSIAIIPVVNITTSY